MASLAKYVTLLTISVCADLGLAQNTNRPADQKNPTKQSETAVKKSNNEKKLNRPALIFVKADRERMYVLLAEQMKQLEFTLTKKDPNKIVFGQRTPGAEAALKRKNFNRVLTTPIIDDPQTIVAFILIEKNKGYVVAGRMIVTTIINSRVFAYDISEEKEARINLNRILQRLKSNAEIPKVTP